MLKTLTLIAYFMGCIVLSAQEKTIKTQNQFWTGYMTSAKLSDRYALWNDFHYVPNGFFVARTGITRSFFQKLYLTSGYAYLNIPTSSKGIELNRTEHRPWMQLAANHGINESLTMINRLRYDMRFRQNFAEGELYDNFTFNHRLRLLLGLRFHFQNLNLFEGTPFVNISNEVLVNFGKNIQANHFNQNRTWLTLGLRFENISVQLGYMHRFVKLAQDQNFVRNHTLVIWISQRFDLRKKDKPSTDQGFFYQVP